MDNLGFDEDAKTWAGALYETIFESDAIETYGDYFAAYEPDYSGDSGWSGQMEYGSDYDNAIDISGFVSPETKNNLDLVAYAVQAWENNWGYVWGTYGNVDAVPVRLQTGTVPGRRPGTTRILSRITGWAAGRRLHRANQGLWLAGRLRPDHRLRGKRRA